MQSKVSIVVPCYNKERYVGAMLESVISQVWNHIELILVNDGSTDGTRVVIEEYAERICKRGYELVVVDQENQGVAAAVKEGLSRITGEYVCQVDSDDEILPGYVSVMADFLDGNPEYAWAACDMEKYNNSEERRRVPWKKDSSFDLEDGRLTEAFILGLINKQVMHYMVRADYLRRCKVAEYFDITRGGPQEAQFVIPLAERGGKLAYFPQMLYRYNFYASEFGSPPTREERVRYTDVFMRATLNTIRTLDVSDERKEYLSALCAILEMKMQMYRDIVAKKDQVARVRELAEKLLRPTPVLLDEIIRRAGVQVLMTALDSVALGIWNPFLDGVPAARRVIGYGALGRIAQEMLPRLEGTALEPTVLWDRGAPGRAVNGKEVIQPKVESLKPEDVVLFFPQGPEVVEEMRTVFEAKGCRVLWGREQAEYLAAVYFRKMLTESSFVPKELQYAK